MLEESSDRALTAVKEESSIGLHKGGETRKGRSRGSPLKGNHFSRSSSFRENKAAKERTLKGISSMREETRPRKGKCNFTK